MLMRSMAAAVKIGRSTDTAAATAAITMISAPSMVSVGIDSCHKRLFCTIGNWGEGDSPHESGD